MQTILYNISQVIGVAIIHSLWQGLLVFLLLRLALLLLTDLSAAAKHNMACAALLAITAWFLYTLSTEIDLYTWVDMKTDNRDIFKAILGMPLHGAPATTYNARYYYTIEGLLPYITLVYVAGLIFNTIKLLWARKKINSIKQGMSIDFQLQLKVAEFVGMLNIKNKVQFGLSKMVDVPCVMGYFKPVILLPFTLSTYLSADEIEIIILHELAHIKRNDYIINLLQQAMSVLLFFNPFAQLINRTINNERENSCDDIVIEATQKPLVYAHALLKLEQTRRHEWQQLMLAATGKKYHLLTRIERIMKTKKPVGNTRHILLAIALLTASITGLAWLNPSIANGKISINKIKPNIITGILTDTTRKKAVKGHKPAAAKKTGSSTTISMDRSADQYNGFKDAELERLSAEVEKHGDAISKYFDSPEFRNMQEDMESKDREIADFENQPQLKQMREDMDRKSAEFDKLNDNPEIKKMQEQLAKTGADMDKYFNSPEYKKMQKQLTDDAVALSTLSYNSPEFKKQSERVANLSKQIGEYAQSAVFKQQQEQAMKMSHAVRDYYESPEFKKQQSEIKALADSMGNVYRSPQVKLQQEQIRQINEKLRAMQNNPQIKREQELMKQASERMRTYMNTPEFKKHLQAWKKAHPDGDWKEHPEASERPEAPEHPEAPEPKEPADTSRN